MIIIVYRTIYLIYYNKYTELVSVKKNITSHVSFSGQYPLNPSLAIFSIYFFRPV